MFAGTAFATAPTVTINSPTLGYFRTTGLVIDFNWIDTNEAHNRVDVNIVLSNVPEDGLADTNILYDINALDNNILGNVANLAGVSVSGGCLNADGNTATTNRCTFTVNTATITDGNYFVDINMSSDDLPTPLIGTRRSTSSVSIDNTAPTTTAAAVLGAINSWTSTTPVTVSLTCADANSGCGTTTYQLDANAMRGVLLGAVTTYAGNISIAPDGNFVLDSNSTDKAGNVEAVSRVTVLIDSNVAIIGTDFLFDINRTGIISGTASVDRFIGLDQNLGFALKWLADVNGNLNGKETAPFVDVNFIAKEDLNTLADRNFLGR